MPSGPVAVTCPAPPDSGGLGRHLREILDALERRGARADCFCASSPPPSRGRLTRRARMTALRPLTRTSRAWRMWARSVDFDRAAAAALEPAEAHLIAFNGTALAQMRAARKAARPLSLVAANSHFRQVLERHATACAAYPIERPWVTHLLARNLAEYELADRILVASDYIHDSFVARGVAAERLARFPLTPHPRFQPPVAATGPGASTFDVVYVGSLQVHKGVPLLIEAFSALKAEDMRLVLVGGWATRTMRRHLQRAQARDGRIAIAPGDPLPHLQRAGLCVHPAYEDGFAYAPAEALACGVPVIVSEDTGMKELVEPGGTGAIVPTGDRAALTEAIAAAYEGTLLHG